MIKQDVHLNGREKSYGEIYWASSDIENSPSWCYLHVCQDGLPYTRRFQWVTKPFEDVGRVSVNPDKSRPSGFLYNYQYESADQELRRTADANVTAH